MGTAQEKVAPEVIYFFKAAPAPADGQEEARRFYLGFAETFSIDQINITLHNVEMGRGVFAAAGDRHVGRIVGLKLGTLKYRKQDVAVFKWPVPRPGWFGVAGEALP